MKPANTKNVSLYVADRYKDVSVELTGKYNERLYYSIKESGYSDSQLSLVFVGKEAENFKSRLTDVDLKILTNVLTDYANFVDHIDFSNNLISAESMPEFSEFISNCSNLKSLNLKFNELGKEGGILLLRGFIQMFEKTGRSYLAYLNLEGCRITTEGLLEISYLDKLYYEKKTLLEQFFVATKNLTELNLSENDIDETGLIELFSLLLPANIDSSIKVLAIDSPYKLRFTEETAYQLSKVLKSNKKLEKLSLRKAGLTDESIVVVLKEMQENSTLRVLDLSANQISYKGCEYLMEYLKSPYCVLQSLIINNNSIGDYGIKFLTESIKTNETLAHIDLNHNRLTNQSLKKIADAIEDSNSLASLNLFWNEFGEESLQAFYDIIKNEQKVFRFDFMIEPTKDGLQIYYYDEELPPNIFVTRSHYF